MRLRVSADTTLPPSLATAFAARASLPPISPVHYHFLLEEVYPNDSCRGVAPACDATHDPSFVAAPSASEADSPLNSP